MARRLGVGIIGCGNISATYLTLAPQFRGIEIRACADVNMDAARARASEYGIRALTVEELLADGAVDIVVNLTTPDAHHAVSARALDAGKHVYSEKPFVLSVREGLDLKRRAERHGLRVGSAPDTFLGGSHQLARKLVDDGALGAVTSGTCTVMSHGMESWHPNPDFFYQPGAGPVLDMGPYYITALVNLIGPVRRVAAMAAIPARERVITSKPRHGETIRVNTPTTVHALLEFASGALVTLVTSWDVWKHGHAPIELYGVAGSLFVPDPNFIGGNVALTKRDVPVRRMPRWEHALSVPNERHPHGDRANYRTVGLADMALAIIEGRPHRCSLELALHAVDVMTAILRSGETGRFMEIRTICERPEALGITAARRLLTRARRARN
jgi:predicted dehydrogenase